MHSVSAPRSSRPCRRVCHQAAITHQLFADGSAVCELPDGSLQSRAAICRLRACHRCVPAAACRLILCRPGAAWRRCWRHATTALLWGQTVGNAEQPAQSWQPEVTKRMLARQGVVASRQSASGTAECGCAEMPEGAMHDLPAAVAAADGRPRPNTSAGAERFWWA